MFKFFRKYQGYFLVVGFTLLMIVFLLTSVVPNASSMFARNPGSEAVGTINGNQKITRTEVAEAGSDLEILASVNANGVPLLPTDEPGVRMTDRQDANLRWALMLREAKALGLETSNAQVSNLMQAIPDLKDESKLEEFARNRAHTNLPGLRKAIGDWIVVQMYRGLVLGREHVRPEEAMLAHYRALMTEFQARMQYERAVEQLGPAFAAMMVRAAIQEAQVRLVESEGLPRISEPLGRRLVNDIDAALPGRDPASGRERMVDTGSKVTAAALLLKADVAATTRPTDAQMRNLFDQYKDNLPGTSEPYHLGYRFPDRVKIEYAELPYDKLKSAVRVREDEAMQYYDQHKDEFPAPPEPEPSTTGPATRAASRPAPKPQRYEDVADKVRATLMDIKAQELANRILKDLDTRLQAKMPPRGSNGYREMKDFQPPALAAEAAQVQDENKVTINVIRKDASWLTAKELAELPGISQSEIDAGPESRIVAPFLNYVMSARELKPKEDNPLLSYYLQVGVPSMPMVNPRTGDRYLFRLIDAEAEHSPASIADVAGDVERDARKLESYRRLQDELPTWIDRARKSWDDTAKMTGVTVAGSSTFARSVLSRQGDIEPAMVEGIGRSGAYVDAVFDHAEQIAGSKPEAVKDMPAAQRIGGVAMDGELSLAVYRIDDYKPIKLSDYREALSAAPALVASLARGKESPLSLEAVQKRLGWVADKSANNQQQQQP